MKEVFPNYYRKFKCIADRCKNSCCIGWEIDIDEDTMELYASLDGALGDRIRENITGQPPHFILKAGDRCPFLNEKGLCDIIIELGEDALCDICYLHPRFSNFHPDFTETGLGLCCEEAVRVILTETEPFVIEVPEKVQGVTFFEKRKEIFSLLQDRRATMLERLKALAEINRVEFLFSNQELYEFYMSLERLDKRWENALEKLKKAESQKVFERRDLQIFFEQLACYFIFRHFQSGVGFALVSCWVIGQICSSCESFDEMLDVVRMYSSEIEYSEDNTHRVIEFFNKKVMKG